MQQTARTLARPVAAFSKARRTRMGGPQAKPTCAGRHDQSRCVGIRPGVISPTHPGASPQFWREMPRETLSSLRAHIDLRCKPNLNCQQKQ